MRRARVRLSTDSDPETDGGGAVTPNATAEDLVTGHPHEDDRRESSLSSQGSTQQTGHRVGPGRRSRYSMNYQSYEATRIQPAEQTRRMLDYMFPGYQKRDPRNWYEKATQTNLNREEVGGLIGIELMEIEPIETEEKPAADKVSHIPLDDDDDDEHSPMKNMKLVKPHARSSVIAKGWDGPPIKVTGKASEEGFRIVIHDLQHEPQAITVPKEVFDERTLRMDVVPDERGIPKVVVYVADQERPSDITIDSNMPEASTVVIFDNKDGFDSRSISTVSSPEPEEEKEETPVRGPSPVREPEPEPTPKKSKALFAPEPVSITPPREPSNDDVFTAIGVARDSIKEPHFSDQRIEIEYDLEDDPKDVDVSEPTLSATFNPRAITNSRLLEPVHSEGDKDDVDVEDMDVSLVPVEETGSDQDLSNEVSNWLAAEIFPKAMTPRKSESPRKKSQTPEPKEFIPEPKVPTPEPADPTPEPTPEPKAPTPEPSPILPPEPKRNLSKEVSDWLNDNIFDDAKKKAAADKKKPKEIIVKPEEPKPPPPEPIKVPEPEPVSEPSFTKAGSHASDPGDRLFAPLENYPNNMDDDLTARSIPTVPLPAPSEVSEEDEPLRVLEDYPPQYDSSHSSPTTSKRASDSQKSPSPIAAGVAKEDELLKALEDYPPQYSSPDASPSTSRKASDSPKSPSPKAVDAAPTKPLPKAGSHSSSPGDRLFSPLEDHPSNVSDEHESPRTTQSKTPSPKPVSPPVAISIEDTKLDPTPTRDGRSRSKSPERAVQPEPMVKPAAITIDDEKREPLPTSIIKSSDGSVQSSPPSHVQIKLKPPSLTDPDESKVNEWLDTEILGPAGTENWVENKILKKAQATVKDEKGTGMPPMDMEPKTESSKRRSSADEKVPSWEGKPVEDWMENEVLIPAQVDSWVEKKIISPAEKQRKSQQKKSSKTPTSEEVENWISEEVIEPAASSSFVQSKVLQPAQVSVAVDDQVLQPAEVSVAVEDQVLGPASSRALEPSPSTRSKPPSLKSNKSLRFEAPVIPGEEEKPAPLVKGPPVLVEHKDEKKPVDDDSLSWVDSSHNLSPFHPHPDHPGDGPKSLKEGLETRFPQVPDQKPTSAASLMQGQPQSGTSGYPDTTPTSFHGLSQQGPAGYGPTAFAAPLFGPSAPGPPPPVYGKQPDATTAHPEHVLPSTPVQRSEQPTLLDEKSSLGKSSIPQGLPSSDVPFPAVEQPSQASKPLEPKETVSLPPPVPRTSVSQIDAASSWGTQPQSPYKQEPAGRDKEKKRESILKNANELLADMSAPRKTSTASKPEKTETRTSLIEKSRIQQDNYLTRDDDEDYKKRPLPKPTKKRRSSSASDFPRKPSDTFLSEKAIRDPHKGDSPSFFSRLCSPFKKSRSRSRSLSRSQKSRVSSYDDDYRKYYYDDALPPIPTKERAVKPVPKPPMKPRRESSSEDDVNGKKTSAPPKSVITESIEEEPAEDKSVPQQPDVTVEGKPGETAPLPVYEQPGQGPPMSFPTAIHGLDQSAGPPVYGQPLQGTPTSMYGQPPQGTPASMYGWPSPHGSPSNVQVGEPSSHPYQARYFGAPAPSEAVYVEDIQTSTLPKFSDYKEAAEKRMKAVGSAESTRIPHPPKRGFPTFPDYEDLTKPKDKVASKDHSWYDAEGQPSPSPFASTDMFPGDSGNVLGKKGSAGTITIGPSVLSVPHQVDAPTSESTKEEISEEKVSSAKNVPPRPMPPGKGIPMFSDYHDLPAGEFPMFRDSPKMASPHSSRSNYDQPPPSNLPYPGQPLQSPMASIPGSTQPQDARSFTGPQVTGQPKLPNMLGSTAHPAESRSQRPWEIPTSRPEGFPTQQPSHVPKITRHSYSHPDRPLSELTKPNLPVLQQGSSFYPEKQQTNSAFQKPEQYNAQQQQQEQFRPDQTHDQGVPPQQPSHVPNIIRHSYSHPDRPLSELTRNLPVTQGGSNLYPEKQQQQPQQVKNAPHVPESSSHDFYLQGVPTFQKPVPYSLQQEQARAEQNYDPTKHQQAGFSGQQVPSMQKPGVYAPGQQSMVSPIYKTPPLQKPWEIPSSRPYSPTEHQTPGMRRPGDYDQRQMFHPQGLTKQAPGSGPSALGQTGKPYSASPGQPMQGPGMTAGLPSLGMPSVGSPGSANQQLTFGQQGTKRAPAASYPDQKPYSTTTPPPTFSKHYYSQPDRPLSELLQPRSPNQQQGSPVPNFQGGRPGESRKENSPLAPGSGIPKFGDYDEIVQSSQPQISGDHDPNNGKRKIVTAAEKKAQIEKEMLPITEQMEKLKKQMYLLTSQKGPPIRTGPHSAHTRLPTSLELYSELERRTMDATKKEREEFRAEQRKKIYEESARRRIRRAIER